MSVVYIKPEPQLITTGNLQKITIKCKDNPEERKESSEQKTIKFTESKLNSFRKTRTKFLRDMNRNENIEDKALKNK